MSGADTSGQPWILPAARKRGRTLVPVPGTWTWLGKPRPLWQVPELVGERHVHRVRPEERARGRTVLVDPALPLVRVQEVRRDLLRELAVGRRLGLDPLQLRLGLFAAAEGGVVQA